MRMRLLKKILWGTGIFLIASVLVLAVHIYIVTRPKAPTADTRAMARIDLTQKINKPDADKITGWLYSQKGIDHVLVNPQTGIVIFTYYPVKTTAGAVTANFTASLPYQAKRITASKEDLAAGCPVATTSITYKIYNFFKSI